MPGAETMRLQVVCTFLDEKVDLSQRLLEVLEALLKIPVGDLKTTLTHVSDLVARATGADKVDSFVYDPARDCLVAVGSSIQPLTMLQRKLGLDVLQISNGGRVVQVYKTGETFTTGRLDQDAEELRGIKEALGIRSKIGVPLVIGGARRGMMMLASLKPDYFTPEDVRFAEWVREWVGILAHRAELMEQSSASALQRGRRAAAEELVTVLAHDLRNLLTPLAMRVDIMGQRARRDQRAEDVEDTQAASRAVRRLSRMVEDILDVARIDQGVFHLQPEAVDLGALVTETVRLLHTPQHPILLNVQEGAPITVAGDPRRLRQCVENLVTNAVQVSPANAAVSVFVTADPRGKPGQARVEISDEGPGIPADILPILFERFATRGDGGLGLGLYLAKRVAQQHAGDLTVQSVPGKGARFSLILPLS